MDRIFRDEAKQEEFERRGFTTVRLLSSADAADLAGRIEEARKVAEGQSCTAGIDQSFCTPDAGYRQRVHALGCEAIEQPLLSQLVGYRLVAAGVMTKKPGAGSMRLHRDRSVMVDLETAAVNAWCPLVDVDDSFGNLVLLPGSHKLPNVETEGLKPFYEDYVEELEKLCVSYPLEAGEAVLFDHRLLHWSRPNRHDEPRPALRSMAVPIDSRLVYYRLDQASDGKRFEILDAEEGGAMAYSPDAFAHGTVTTARLGLAENENRDVSFRECLSCAAQASDMPLFPFAMRWVKSAVSDFRARLSA